MEVLGAGRWIEYVLLNTVCVCVFDITKVTGSEELRDGQIHTHTH